MKRYTGLVTIVMAIALATLIVGSGAAQTTEWEFCGSCHPEKVEAQMGNKHKDILYWAQQLIDPTLTFSCEVCHPGARDHGKDMGKKVTVNFELELCGQCHVDQYLTHIYGDSYKTRYGGSPGPQEAEAIGTQPVNTAIGDVGSLWAKTKDFNYYNTIIDGNGFVKEYNEERGHAVILLDHKDITRFKFETCIQCKSTKVAYYWDSGKTRTIQSDVTVTSGHFAAGETITIPADTKVVMSTDRETPDPDTGQPNHEVKVLVTLPTGVQYASYDAAGVPTENIGKYNLTARKWLWAAVYALTVDGLPTGSPTIASGTSCGHCHDPHYTKFRIIRKSLINAISRRGVNPYDPAKAAIKSFDDPALSIMDRNILLCAQCHVEYVCANSPIDKTDRDFFPWAKVSDLESIYKSQFNNDQDWYHGTGVRPWQSTDPALPGYYPAGALYPINEKLIKNQHPEAETYWQSRHYGNNASCDICHMPQVTLDPAQVPDSQLVGPRKRTFTSHWFASPVKYMTSGPVSRFASYAKVLLDEGIIVPCGACHGGNLARMADKATKIQDNTYADALTVQDALVNALKEIKTTKDAGVPSSNPNLISAIKNYQAAHVRWESLAVSENSMGFHNPSEADAELGNALSYAQAAASYARKARGLKR
jgi:formate-dependent nitrite reductase cytochrome c552 subunit